jgi:hypothetical protein
VDITWKTYNSRGSTKLDWTCVRIAATISKSESDYIIFVIKSIVTSCIRAATKASKSDHIKSVVTTTTTSDNRVAIIRVDNNPSINNNTIVNKGIRKATIDFIYNRESDSASIWDIGRTYYNTDKANCCIDKSNFWSTRSKTTKH